MTAWKPIAALLVAGSTVGAVGVSRELLRKPAARSAVPTATALHEGQTITVVHRHVIEQAPQGTPQPAGSIAVANGDEGETRTERDVTLEMEQRFEAAPEDIAVQRRNEQVLQGVLNRVSGGKPLPMEGFSCRGNACRATFNFQTAEQARATLNELPKDADWNRNGLGFEAMQKDPSNPDSNEFIVYFSAPLNDPRANRGP